MSPHIVFLGFLQGWLAEAIFEDLDKGDWLAVAELDFLDPLITGRTG